MFRQNILILISLLLYSNIFFGQNVNQNIKFYDNENIKKIQTEKGAIKTELVFFENGLLQRISSYYLNKKHGKYLSYYNNGQLFVDGQYTKGIPTGNWIEFYNNGDTLCKYSFRNDTLILDKYELSEPIITFDKSANKFKSGEKNYFQVIFPNLPNNFIFLSIYYGQMIKLGANKYGFIAKKPGKAEIIFSLKKNNCTENNIIYKKKLIIE